MLHVPNSSQNLNHLSEFNENNNTTATEEGKSLTVLEKNTDNKVFSSLQQLTAHNNTNNNDTNEVYNIEKRLKSKQRGGHPNIQHRPAIHPRSNYQRVNNNCASKAQVMTADCSSGAACVAQNPVMNNKNLEAANFQPSEIDMIDFNTLNSNGNVSTSELQNVESNIKQYTDLIDKLNFEIFKNPRNYTRPPSEYLEIYNSFTEQLHNLQLRKQTIDSQQTDNNQSSQLDESDPSMNMPIIASTPESKSDIIKSSSKTVDLENVLHNNNNNNNTNIEQQSSISNKNSSSEVFDSRKPPLPKANSTLPKFKLDHPTTLITQSVNTPTVAKHVNSNSASPSLSHRGGSRSSSIAQFYISNSVQASPATTPNFPNAPDDDSSSQNLTKIFYHEKNRSDQSSSPPDHLSLTYNNSLSPNCTSPSYSNQNQKRLHSNLTNDQTSHSYADFSDAVISNQNASYSNTNPTTPTFNTSFSPSSSIATTPTLNGNNLFSAFLRIYIGSSTAVVEKKAVPLREALSSKLKSRSLDVDKCIAYIKDSNIKIEWDMEVSRIVADSIVVAELSDEIQHSFERKTFTFRSCDWCKKRFVLNAYACAKCDYIMCQRNECRSKSELIACVPRRFFNIHNVSSTGATSAIITKTDVDFGRPDSPIKENTINISQQILPVNQLKVSVPCRDRSRSETELNMFGNMKLSLENTVQKSPSTLVNSVNNNSLYGTLPHKFSLKKQSHNATSDSSIVTNDSSSLNQISGSINEGSGSVINSLSTSKSTEITNTDQDNIVNFRNDQSKSKSPGLNKLHKPSRRDSFNAWEIPFKQIKIDMNKKVGSGSFGIVHQGKDFYHGVVAIKFLNVQNPTPHQSHAFRNEVAILKSTRHDNVLLFIGCILKPYLAIVTEWCPGSSLYKHIHVEEEHWEMNQLVDIAKQTATGMEYLHARDILHRDMKSNNIFLIPKETYNPRYNQYYQNHYQNGKLSGENCDEMWTVKIGDFGLATVKSTWTQTSAKTNQPTGSILWMAPEVIIQKVADPYTHKSDVYSFAVVLYELVTGHLPYLQKEQNMILFLVGSGRLKLNVEDARDDTPEGIKDLIRICAEYDRNKRLEFVEINERLKKIRPVKLKSKIHRAQSVPSLAYNHGQDQSYLSNFGMYEDEMYPLTPDLDSLRKLEESTNNFNLKNSNNNLSQFITNM